MKFRLINQFQTPKDPQYTIEDAWYISDTGLKVGLSDGASESFDSACWAGGLVELAVKESSRFSVNTIRQAVYKYYREIKFDNLSWSQQAAMARGSFATLLLLEKKKEETSIQITAIGDSEAFLVEKETGKCVACFPYTHEEEFLQHPLLLSTLSEYNTIFTEEKISKLQCQWDLRGRMIFLMTDALACWSLKRKDKDGFWINLTKINNEKNFNNFIIKEQKEKQMKTDDVTMLIVSLDDE